jgi:transposase
MRGNDNQLQPGMFSYVSLEERVPTEHPLRAIRELVDTVLAQMSPDFAGLYAAGGRPSIPPERLFRALLLQVFYSVRSERLLMEQLNYNLLFRWFVGLEIDEAVWHHAVFSKNRDRLLNQELAHSFFAQVKAQAAGLMSDEHFTVDGTLIEAWAGQNSFRRKGSHEDDPEAGRDFHGEKRTNETHESKTDPEARLYKKSQGQEAKLSYLGHTVVENRHGLIVAAMATQANGTAEREAGILMLTDLTEGGSQRITVGADKASDTQDFVTTVPGVAGDAARQAEQQESTQRH